MAKHGIKFKIGLAFLVVVALIMFMGDRAIANPAYSDEVNKYFDFSHFKTGEDLLNFCTSEKVSNINICLGYIEGVADTVNYLLFIHGKPKMYCLPKLTGNDHLGRLFKKFMKKNPKYLESMASNIIVMTLTEAFPCPTK